MFSRGFFLQLLVAMDTGVFSFSEKKLLRSNYIRFVQTATSTEIYIHFKQYYFLSVIILAEEDHTL